MRKFTIGDFVTCHDISGERKTLEVGGYMEEPPIPYPAYVYMFFEKDNEEAGWFDDRNFEEASGIEILERIANEKI